jgi:hypothetical protein
MTALVIEPHAACLNYLPTFLFVCALWELIGMYRLAYKEHHAVWTSLRPALAFEPINPCSFMLYVVESRPFAEVSSIVPKCGDSHAQLLQISKSAMFSVMCLTFLGIIS